MKQYRANLMLRGSILIMLICFFYAGFPVDMGVLAGLFAGTRKPILARALAALTRLRGVATTAGKDTSLN